MEKVGGEVEGSLIKARLWSPHPKLQCTSLISLQRSVSVALQNVNLAPYPLQRSYKQVQ